MLDTEGEVMLNRTLSQGCFSRVFGSVGRCLLALALCWSVTACGDDDGPDAPSPETDVVVATDVAPEDSVSTLDTAEPPAPDVGSPDTGVEPPSEVPFVELEPPEKGFQIHSKGGWIPSGVDVEYCEVVTLPGTMEDTYYVDRLEVAMHPWSHHVIVSAAEAGTEADAAMEEGMSVKCVTGESAYGDGLVDVIGAQAPYNQLDLPDGVGRIYHGGQKVVVDYHYFNPTPDPIPARHAINFHTVDEEDVEHVAQTWGFYNFMILAMPGQQASYAAECTFKEDVMLYSLTRHTHRWGTDFHIWHKGGEKDGEHLWTSNDWELEVDYVFDEPVLIPKGEGFTFQCEFDNTSDHILKFGVKATDEMCILFGVAWSPDGLVLPPQSCDASTVAPKDMSAP
jgi:hypothetical protein